MNQQQRILNNPNAQVIEVGSTYYKGLNPQYTRVVHPITRQELYIKTSKGVPYVKIC